ncbi:MAG: proline--tRNA ligase [Planctomycetales bacterium]
MRWSQTFIPTLKEVPADAEVPSHRLMLRAGLIRQLMAGAYTYLPLGWKALRKAEAIVREEMESAGAIELHMPALHPIELYERTGRRAAFGNVLINFQVARGDRKVHLALGPTHEEVVTDLVAHHVSSYRQLPLTLFQIQTKFRNEERPRFGVLRTSEFLMKDAYSFSTSLEQLDEVYRRQYRAYCRIFARAGLAYVPVEAESGPIGGSASHEFMVLTPNGEDVLLASDKGNYAANREKCEIGERKPNFEGEPTHERKEIHTPDCKSIADLCAGWPKFAGSKLKPKNTLKTLVFRVWPELTADEKKEDAAQLNQGMPVADWYFNWIVVLRGDHELNEGKFRRELQEIHLHEVNFVGKQVGLRLMSEEDAQAAGFQIGYVGPDAFKYLSTHQASHTRIIIDPDAAQSQFWVAGANKKDHHCVNFNWKRDCIDGTSFRHIMHVRDIRNAVEGDPSPKNDGGILHESRGIEVGHVFKLGTKYSEALGATFLDEKEQRHPIIMGCYGIGVNRIIAAAAETSHDENGLIWPLAIAPYEVLLIPLNVTDAEVMATANRYYDELRAAGVDVLFDDRDARPGFKFKDADLIGIPLRVVIGGRGLQEGQVEIKWRTAAEPEKAPVEAGVRRVVEMLAARRAEDARGVPA